MPRARIRLAARRLAGRPEARVLDLGCGAGHVSFQVAALAGEVVAYDLSAEMLAVVAQSAAERGMANIRTEQGKAESLPSPTASSISSSVAIPPITGATSAWPCARCDGCSSPAGWRSSSTWRRPGRPLPDTFLQTVELLRDTSHVRNYSPAEWAAPERRGGLLVTGSRRQRLRLEFQSWVERMRTPEVFRQAIRSLQLAVGEEVREYFEIADDGSFSTDVLVLWLRRE